METSALFTFPPDEDDDDDDDDEKKKKKKNVYLRQLRTDSIRPALPPSSRGSPIRCSCPDDVQPCLLDPPLSPLLSPSLVWPFDREESISEEEERHVSKVSDAPPLPLSGKAERCESLRGRL